MSAGSIHLGPDAFDALMRGTCPKGDVLVTAESIERFQDRGLAVSPGDFAENITVEGLDLLCLTVGRRLRIGDDARFEVTQMGKQCHGRCRSTMDSRRETVYTPMEDILQRRARRPAMKTRPIET